MLLYTWQEAGKEGCLILSSGAKYNQINFSKNHVSGNARKIGVTFIWWFTKYLHTNPTACNHQEVMVYVFMHEGVFLYDSTKNCLLQIKKKDCRK